ncbi:MAG: DUF3455 domain-containing protein [Planctomycetaceae bacterium]|nr:DUF3455 domain-containing protein [Planctomycetaceae bacterium]
MVDFTWRGAAMRAVLILFLGLGLVVRVGAEPGNDNRAPDLGDAQNLRVEEGHKVAFRAYAEGVQIWSWNGASWDFLRPEAVLYAGADDDELFGIHYAGPTWESDSGSYVVGAVVDRATPNPDAIPWLLLKGVESGGPGIFDGVTFIQRVNTVGGKAPAYDGDFPGEEVGVPYTADYYFYRKHD